MGIFGYVALLVASTLIMRVLAPKPKGPKAAALEDFTVPTAEVGRPIPWVFGTRKIKDPNCIWYGDLRTNRKKKDDGTFFWYYMGLHLEICIGPVDGIFSIAYGDKVCWSGSITETTYGTVIDQQNLYGGIRSEGGIWIAFDAMFGDADQPANTYMESQLGAPVSAFRDSLTLVFHQGIISANSAYVRPIMPTVQSIYSGWPDECWFQETAGIVPRVNYGDTNQLMREIMRHDPGLFARFEEKTDGSGNFLSTAVNDGSGPDGTYHIAPRAVAGIVPDGAQAASMHGNGAAAIHYPQHADYSYTTNNRISIACKLQFDADFRDYDTHYLWHEGDHGLSGNIGLGAFFTIGAQDTLTVIYYAGGDFRSAQVTISSGKMVGGASAFVLISISKTGGSNGKGYFDLYLGCDGAHVGGASFPNYAIPGTSSTPAVKIGSVRGELVDTYQIHATIDNFAIFPRTLNARDIERLARAYCGGTLRLDMNPAHIIYRVWTDQHQGMAYDPAMIDDAAMRYCAQLLYDEEFGISMYWARQESIENFVAEVCRHADLLQSINPRTGQLRLIALRDDYEIENLIEVTEDDIIEIVEWQEAASGEGTNTVTVTYEDRNGDQQAVTYQNRAAALHYGVIAQTIDYPGITTAELAMRVAERECRKLGGNFAKGKIKCNRLPWNIMPGAVFVLSHGPEGIGPIVVRVLEWSGGTLTSGAITLTIVQDVFSLKRDVSRFFPQRGEWAAPDTDAAPCELETVQELPYWMALQAFGIAETAAIPEDAGYVLALGARPTPLTTDIDIWTGVPPNQITQTAEDRGVVPVALLTDAIDYLDNTAIAITDGIDLGDAQPGWLAQIGEGAGAEIVLVNAVNGSHIDITRGVLDTVPHRWPAATRLFFIPFDQRSWPYSPAQYADGDDVIVRLQTGSQAGEIDIEEAADLSITIASRMIRPYPPGGIMINGESQPDDDPPITGTVEITWHHRDRVAQGTAIIAQDDATDYGPESGTTYNVWAIDDDDDSVIDSDTGISAKTWSPDLDAVSGEIVLRIELESARDGYTSWQRQVRAIAYSGDYLALAHLGDRGLRGGGTVPSGGPRTASIDYIAIPTTGNATSFGSLSSARGSGLAGGSNGTRGLFAGGGTDGGPTATQTVDYVTIATTSSTASWGNLTSKRHYCTGDSDGTYTMVGGGYDGGTEIKSVERLVTATGASKTAWGNLSVTRWAFASASDDTTAVWMGGLSSGVAVKSIDATIIATTGSATGFGDLTAAQYFGAAAASNSKRGVYGGGNDGSARAGIEYVSIPTTGNATAFGSLTLARSGVAAVSSGTRIAWSGGYDGSTYDDIDYVDPDTLANAVSFGDLTIVVRDTAGLSGD